MEPLVILIAFIAGLCFRSVGYPPLLGYLLAGFFAHSLGLGHGEAIHTISELGIMLLLFTIGLKLNLRELATAQVWGVAILQMLVVVPLTWIVIVLAGHLVPSLALPNLEAALILAFALSFSSTVFATKTFEERGEAAAIHATIAIGVLIIQDLLAVTYMATSTGKFPSGLAVLLLALPLIRPLLGWLLVTVGHGELLVLFGLVIAVGGATLFDAVNIKGDLGALAMGMLLNSHSKSTELYKNLLHFKDIFLIGFFLQIGYNGLPDGMMILAAIALAALICLRPIIYFLLFTLFRLRARTAALAALSLATYSEFGLIVADLAAEQGLMGRSWVTAIALAMSLSFFVATPLNSQIRDMYNRVARRLQRLERIRHPKEDTLMPVGNAEIIIVGAGRVGRGAYSFLDTQYPGNVVCIEENGEKAESLKQQGINCVHDDGNDLEFWQHADLEHRKLILVSLTNHRENIEVIKLLRSLNFGGQLAVISRYPDEEQEIRELGCITFNLYSEAGHGFAEHVLSQTEATPGLL